jgi:tRNA (guanine-N7-)-methyltransferase
MTRHKLKHFDDLKQWKHVHEPTADSASGLSGTWGPKVLLELGCGQGDYALSLAERLPEFIIVGVDIKGARMWHGAKKALDRGLENLNFLRTRIEDLHLYFAPEEVDEIWVTFPDPHPRKGRAKKRLTSPRFTNMYRELLKEGGILHLKTDNLPLFDYSVETLKEEGWTLHQELRDVYAEKGDELFRTVQTQYERRYLAEGKPIYYLAASY